MRFIQTEFHSLFSNYLNADGNNWSATEYLINMNTNELRRNTLTAVHAEKALEVYINGYQKTYFL